MSNYVWDIVNSVARRIVAGTNITITETNDAVTINSSGGSGLTQAQVMARLSLRI